MELADRKKLDQLLLDICREFNVGGVRYILIGGWAVIIHGFPRLTNDIDFLIDHSPENIVKIINALKNIFHDEAIEDIKPMDVADYSVVRYVSPEGICIDLMGRVGEVADFSTLSEHIELFEVCETEIPILNTEMLIKLKETTRDKDKLDLAFLKEKLKREKEGQK